jgi:hypothetical protein
MEGAVDSIHVAGTAKREPGMGLGFAETGLTALTSRQAISF